MDLIRYSPPDYTVKDFLYVLFKRKRLILTIFLIIVLPAVLGLLAKTPIYEASAKVLVKGGRAEIQITPSDTSRFKNWVLSPQTINSEVELIKSRQLLEKVVEDLRLGLAEKNGSSLTATSQGKKSILFSFQKKVRAVLNLPGRMVENIVGLISPREEIGESERQLINLQKSLKIEPIPSSNLIRISYRSPDPLLAAKVVNTLTDLYIDYHVKIHRAKGVYQFFQNQKREAGQKLQEAENAFKEFQTREGIVSLDEQKKMSIRKLADFDTLLKNTESEINETKERIGVIQKQLTNQPEVITTNTEIISNPKIELLSQKLLQLEVEKNNLLLKYTEKDRRVRDKEKEIAMIKEKLTKENEKIVGTQVNALNTIHRDLQEELLKSTVALRVLGTKRDYLAEQVNRYLDEMEKINQKGFELKRLEQEVRRYRDLYLSYSQKEEQARLSDVMDKEKFANVAIAEKAEIPFQPLRAKRMLRLFLFIITGMVGGLGAAFFLEFFDRSFKTEEDVERYLGLPLLAAIPEIEKE